MKPTLLVLAAGMGSRYGGVKQIDGVGLHDECLLDFATYDAMNSGFGKVVFIIRKDIEEAFRERLFDRIAKNFDAEYVFQQHESLLTPEQLKDSEGREKPWGTTHAVLCAEKAVKTPFAVINSDDFYGAEAFKCLADYLGKTQANDNIHRYSMAAYMLKNTLTENGSVSRGVCLDKDGNLTSITEHTKIERLSDGRLINTDENGKIEELDENLHVSMNCWGFTPEFFGTLEKGLKDFFEINKGEKLNKAEYYLLTAVQDEIDAGTATVKLLETDAKWFGVTYKEDRPKVVEAIRKLIADGVYPEKLWK